MNRSYDHGMPPRRVGFWVVVGYLLLGAVGILLGAVLVYAAVVFVLEPEDESPTLALDEERPVEEELNDEQVADPEIPLNGEEEEILRDETAPPATVVPPPGLPPVSLADVIEEVMPAVVGVNGHYYISRFGQEMLREIEQGSGVIVSPDGYVVTNQHVIEGADRVTVVLPGQGRYDASIVGSDELTDLALLKIEEEGLIYTELADSDLLRVGDSVLAIGNPLGLQQTVTAGIISAVKRQVRFAGTNYAYTFLQTDALVNPGNSGGPLVNLAGQVVGINTAKVAVLGVEGIGLSIPSNTVKRVITDFVEHGKVLRPHLGVIIDEYIDFEGGEPQTGIILEEVAPDSPAENAGLRPGDIIVGIDDQDIDFMAQLFDSLLTYYPGDRITIYYYRGGELLDTILTLGERPENMPLVLDDE